ncbi:MAG: hypothetical protein LBU34_08325, partial [Planctomycetaceae bacterium]|nr:hypothetical protein [Planctomycetaceae bacterium]
TGEFGQTCVLVHNAKYPRNPNGTFAKGAGGETADTIRGKIAHENYKNTLPSGYQFNKALPSGNRPDAINYKEKIVRELKPATKKKIAEGRRQLQKYLEELGDGWKGFIDTYNP